MSNCGSLLEAGSSGKFQIHVSKYALINSRFIHCLPVVTILRRSDMEVASIFKRALKSLPILKPSKKLLRNYFVLSNTFFNGRDFALMSS